MKPVSNYAATVNIINPHGFPLRLEIPVQGYTLDAGTSTGRLLIRGPGQGRSAVVDSEAFTTVDTVNNQYVIEVPAEDTDYLQVMEGKPYTWSFDADTDVFRLQGSFLSSYDTGHAPGEPHRSSVTVGELQIEVSFSFASGGSGGGAVDSVFGRTGAVTAQTGDYTAEQVGATPSETIQEDTSGGDVQVTLEDPITVPGKEVVIYNWRGSTGDNKIQVSNTIEGNDGPWNLYVGEKVRLKSAIIEGTSDYEWIILNVSDEIDETGLIVGAFGTDPGSGGGALYHPDMVLVFSSQDLPDPEDDGDGGLVQVLVTGKIYRLIGNVILPYKIVPQGNLVIGDSPFVELTGVSRFGGVIFGSCTNYQAGSLSLQNVRFGLVGAKLFELTNTKSTDKIYIENVDLVGGEPGDISGVKNTEIHNFSFSNATGPFQLSNVESIFIDNIEGTSGTLSDSLLKVYGPCNYASVHNVNFTPAGTGSAFHLDSSITGFISILHGLLNDSAGGTDYSATSLDEKDSNVLVKDIFNMSSSVPPS